MLLITKSNLFIFCLTILEFASSFYCQPEFHLYTEFDTKNNYYLIDDKNFKK